MPEERSRQLIDNVWQYVTDEQGGNGGSQPFRVVTLDIAFDTAGLVIPASGPAGIHLADVAEFEAHVLAKSDVFMGLQVLEAWDGTTPQLNFCTTAGRGDLPGTPPAPYNFVGPIETADADDTGTGAFRAESMSLSQELFYFVPATSIYAYVDDGAGSDPMSSQGAGRIVLLLLDQS